MSYKRRRAITFVYWPFTPTDGFAARCEARLCLAVRAQLEVGACPRRPLAQELLGRSPNRGPSPLLKRKCRQGRALPHIRRRSRESAAHIGRRSFAFHQAAEPGVGGSYRPT